MDPLRPLLHLNPVKHTKHTEPKTVIACNLTHDEIALQKTIKDGQSRYRLNVLLAKFQPNKFTGN